MKTFSLPEKSRGFALMALLCAIAIILVVFVGVMYWVASNSQEMRKNEVYTTSEAAAEGVSEYVFGNMDRDYLYGNLGTSNYYQSLVGSLNTNNWPVRYNFNVSVVMGPPDTNLEYLGSQYTNLLGEPQTNTVTVTATPLGQPYNVPSTVSQTFVFCSIPAFQFAIFYNINLEIDPGGTLPVEGAVFSNAGIWSGTPNVTYSYTVEAAGQVTTNGTDPFASGKSDTGTPQSSFTYASSPPQPESECNPLHIPIGASDTSTNNNSTNVQAIIQIPPSYVCAPNPAAYEETNQVYDFNAASLIVSNWFWGTNGVAPWSNCYTVYLQDNNQNPSYVQLNGIATNWVMLTNNYYVVSNYYQGHSNFWTTNWVPNFRFTNNTLALKWTNTTTPWQGTNYVWYAGFSFLTNATFYDYRESATVRAVQVDVGKLGAWITNAAPNGGSNWNEELCEDVGHGINSMYVYNAVPFVGQKQLPAVRVMDGQLLPYSYCKNTNGGTVFTCGFSFATPVPMYVLGNYNVQTNGGSVLLASHNTADTFPAAFLADAITILSSNWSDAYNSGTSVSSRTPVATTINAGCLEGIVPSVGDNYSGGVENFLRLLENWSSSSKLTYNGSIMVMFPSSYATNLWSGSYYGVPTRDWGFDTNFLIESELPSLTPQFKAVVRNTWSGY